MDFKLIFNKLEEMSNYRVHLAKQAGATKPIDVLARSKEEWKNWQMHKGKRNRFPVDYIISFAQINGDRFLFGGVFKVINRTKESYEVQLLEDYEDLIGRVVLEYRGTSKRNTVFKLENIFQKLRIIEIYAKKYSGEPFKSLDDIDHSYSSLKTIFDNKLEDWEIILKNSRGIYLLVDEKTGKQYVGKANGENGFWGRWSDYINTLHGGNTQLIELVKNEGEEYFKNNFKFTILEVVGSYITETEIDQKESKWKKKLFTRKHGYNSN